MNNTTHTLTVKIARLTELILSSATFTENDFKIDYIKKELIISEINLFNNYLLNFANNIEQLKILTINTKYSPSANTNNEVDDYISQLFKFRDIAIKYINEGEMIDYINGIDNCIASSLLLSIKLRT